MATMTITDIPQEELEQLHREVERYLAAVETFRAEGCEPVWADEPSACAFSLSV
jgi:hypothetical protein